MSDEKKGFTVKDRRLFTPDGERRAQEPDEPPPPPREPERVAVSEPVRPAARPEAPATPPPRGGEVGFSAFLMSLAAQAGSLLDAEQPEALEGARQIISVLEMLRDKTEGRRTPEEEQVLEGLLYELRLAYVERARTARV